MRRRGALAVLVAPPACIMLAGRRPPKAEYALPPVSQAEWDSVPQRSGVMAVGIHRKLPPAALEKGRWTGDSEDAVWTLTLRSPGAAGIRLHFTRFDAGSGRFVLKGADSHEAGPYTGRGIHGDGEFWSEVVPGEWVRIEYRGRRTPSVPFEIPEISHLRTLKF